MEPLIPGRPKKDTTSKKYLPLLFYKSCSLTKVLLCIVIVFMTIYLPDLLNRESTIWTYSSTATVKLQQRNQYEKLTNFLKGYGNYYYGKIVGSDGPNVTPRHIIGPPINYHNLNCSVYSKTRLMPYKPLPNGTYDLSVLYIAQAGRLGNQLFPFASCVGLATRYNKTCLIQANDSVLSILRLNETNSGFLIKTITPKRLKHMALRGVGEHIAEAADEQIMNASIMADHNNAGTYLQSYLYFSEVIDRIRCLIRFIPPIADIAHEILTNISARYARPTHIDLTALNLNISRRLIDAAIYKGPHVRCLFNRLKFFSPAESNVVNSSQFLGTNTSSVLHLNTTTNNPRPIIYVSIHVRRGDFLDNVGWGRTVQDEAWLLRAMTLANETHSLSNPGSSIIFVFCSEDIVWCMNVTRDFPFDMAYVMSKVAEVDLAVLASCNHSIMGYSTFGWWGALLAGGDVIYFKNMSVPGSEWSKQVRPKEYFLPQWRGLL